MKAPATEPSMPSTGDPIGCLCRYARETNTWPKMGPYLKSKDCERQTGARKRIAVSDAPDASDDELQGRGGGDGQQRHAGRQLGAEQSRAVNGRGAHLFVAHPMLRRAGPAPPRLSCASARRAPLPPSPGRAFAKAAPASPIKDKGGNLKVRLSRPFSHLKRHYCSIAPPSRDAHCVSSNGPRTPSSPRSLPARPSAHSHGARLHSRRESVTLR